ncbi:MAG: family transcriptional regulator [Clostridiales bacterium]|nr:family transcriptional regulator [Clostridiales bacterium]
MKEINIGAVLLNKRREKGITQDVLANYIGVSKAAISNWETAQNYPDITLLPILAAYFNISLDELMGYGDKSSVYKSLNACRSTSKDDGTLNERKRIFSPNSN